LPKRPSWRALLSSSGLLSARRYNYSDTWQLVINTATTIITFLMLFIIQNTQNRDARAIQLKLDELIRAVTGARTGLGRMAATGQGPNSDYSIPDPALKLKEARGAE
jgi:hypothetical protein